RAVARQPFQPQLFETLADRVQLRRAVGDQLAALAAELERFAQAGLAGVESLDELLQPFDRGLRGLRLLAHPSLLPRSISAPTRPSAKRSLTRPAAIAA